MSRFCPETTSAPRSPVTSGPTNATMPRRRTATPGNVAASMFHLQRTLGNQAVQRLVVARQGGDLDDDVESAIQRKRGGGSGLDSGVRGQMESAFGVDFSPVRIHTDDESHTLNKAVNSVAFATGNDVFFRRGAYDPASRSGKELLAHELTHVVQQGGSTVQGKLQLGEPDDAYEQEADRVASDVVASLDRPAAHSKTAVGSSGGPAAVHRQCATCGKSAPADEPCPSCAASKTAARSVAASRPGNASAASTIELLPATSLPPLTGKVDRVAAAREEVVPVREAVVTRDGIRRKVTLTGGSAGWISRKWNVGRSLCHAACWGLGGGLAAVIAAACAIGTTVTIGGLAIPCVYLVVGGAVAAGGLAALCSDACDQAIADNPTAATEVDPSTPAVADASGEAVSDQSVDDLAQVA